MHILTQEIYFKIFKGNLHSFSLFEKAYEKITLCLDVICGRHDAESLQG